MGERAPPRGGGAVGKRMLVRGRVLRAGEVDEFGNTVPLEELRCIPVVGRPVRYEHDTRFGDIGRIKNATMSNDGWLWAEAEVNSERDASKMGADFPGWLRDELRTGGICDFSVGLRYKADRNKKRVGPATIEEISLVKRGKYQGTHLVHVEASAGAAAADGAVPPDAPSDAFHDIVRRIIVSAEFIDGDATASGASGGASADANDANDANDAADGATVDANGAADGATEAGTSGAPDAPTGAPDAPSGAPDAPSGAPDAPSGAPVVNTASGAGADAASAASAAGVPGGPKGAPTAPGPAPPADAMDVDASDAAPRAPPMNETPPRPQPAPAPATAPAAPAPPPAVSAPPAMSTPAQSSDAPPAVPASMSGSLAPQSIVEQAAAAGVPFTQEEVAGKSAGELMGLMLHKFAQHSSEVARQKMFADKVVAENEKRRAAEMQPKLDAVRKYAAEMGMTDEAALKLVHATYLTPEGAPMAQLLDTFVQTGTTRAAEAAAAKKAAEEHAAKVADLEKRLQGFQEKEALSAANSRKRGPAGQFVPERMATGGAPVGAAAGADAAPVNDVAVNAGYGQRDTATSLDSASKRWRNESMLQANPALDRDAVARVHSILARIDRGDVEADFSNVTFGRNMVHDWLSGDGNTTEEVAVNASSLSTKQGGIHTGGCTAYDLKIAAKLYARSKRGVDPSDAM